MTSQRASLSVPDPSPDTSMNLGAAWDSQDWNSDGFTVNTLGRVWLQASGSEESSTLTVLSNGGKEVGQLLLQSLSKNVYLMAKGTTIVGANGSMLIAGTDSVKLCGAIGIDVLTLMGTIHSDDSLSMIAPSATDPSSDSASDFVDSVESFTDWATLWQASSLALSLLCDGLRFLGGAYGSGGKSTLAAGASAIALFAKTTAGLVSSNRLYGDGVKGLHCQAVGSVNVGTPAFGAFYAGLATLCQAMTTSTYGLDAHVFAGITAGVRSLFYVKLDGSEIECTAGVTLELASRTSGFTTYAPELQYGALGGEAGAQLPTATCTLQAVKEISAIVAPGDIKMTAGANVALSADKVGYLCGTSMTISSPAYSVEISAKGIEINVLDVSKVTVDATGVVADVGGAHSVEVTADAITLGSPSSFIAVNPAGTWQFTAASLIFT